MITQAKFNRATKDFMEDTRSKIIDKIIQVDAIDTGDMFRSIDYSLTGGANKFVGSFNGINYTKFVDEGTKHISPRKFYKDVIEKQSNRFESFINEPRSNFDSYTFIDLNSYGVLELRISIKENRNNKWWSFKIKADS